MCVLRASLHVGGGGNLVFQVDDLGVEGSPSEGECSDDGDVDDCDVSGADHSEDKTILQCDRAVVSSSCASTRTASDVACGTSSFTLSSSATALVLVGRAKAYAHNYDPSVCLIVNTTNFNRVERVLEL